MPVYEFEARDGSGAEYRDTLEALTSQAAETQLRQRGLTVTRIAERSNVLPRTLREYLPEHLHPSAEKLAPELMDTEIISIVSTIDYPWMIERERAGIREFAFLKTPEGKGRAVAVFHGERGDSVKRSNLYNETTATLLQMAGRTPGGRKAAPGVAPVPVRRAAPRTPANPWGAIGGGIGAVAVLSLIAWITWLGAQNKDRLAKSETGTTTVGPTTTEPGTTTSGTSTQTSQTTSTSPLPTPQEVPAVVVNQEAASSLAGPEYATAKGKGVSQNGKQDRFALVVGINDYADPAITDLTVAENDARAVHSLLTNSSVGGADPTRSELLVGKDATREGVVNALNRLRSVSPGATVFLYFSGHGVQDGDDGYWLTQDAKVSSLDGTALPKVLLDNLLEKIHAERKVVIIDACHAAATTTGRTGRKGLAEQVPTFTGKGHATLTAAAGGQEALEAPDLKHSLFTFFVLEALKGQADANQDGVIVLPELRAFVDEKVAEEAHRRGGNQKMVVHEQGIENATRFWLSVEPQRRAAVLKKLEADAKLKEQRVAKVSQLAVDGKIDLAQQSEALQLLDKPASKLTDLERRVLDAYCQVLDGPVKPDALKALLNQARSRGK